MLVRAPEYKLIEKTITTKSGKIVSVLVAVTYFEDKVVSARIVSVRPLESAEQSSPLLLTSDEACEAISCACATPLQTVFSYLDFSFLMSQPTRAPATN